MNNRRPGRRDSQTSRRIFIRVSGGCDIIPRIEPRAMVIGVIDDKMAAVLAKSKK
jgi:hypothetical protein